ncbi:MAG: type II CRISPR-associated endonuclease Cas1 [Bacteroidales bacterium]|nr:type II CRISPR-associated endonuclease Cas1 [Bacteroidales bacterium]
MIKKTLCFSNPAYLSLKNNQLVIQLLNAPEQGDTDMLKTKTVPIEDLGVVILDNRQITITSGLISALLDNNCALITCDGKSLPTGLLLNLCGNTLQNERFRAQVDASLPLVKQMWQQTVAQKIYNQASVLSQCTDAEVACMRIWSKQVKSGDPDNLEARAAAYYWKYLFPEEKDFTRSREGGGPNVLLNYGYAILRATIARALVGSGLLPTLGIHHHNKYNAYCLADDIMEPYRPYVDSYVVSLTKKYGEVAELTREHKADLLQIPVLDVVLDGKRSPLMVAAGLTTASLSKCFEGKCRKISYPVYD